MGHTKKEMNSMEEKYGSRKAAAIYAAVFHKGDAPPLSETFMVSDVASTNVDELAREIAGRQTTFPQIHLIKSQQHQFMVNATIAGFVYVVVADNGFSVGILHSYIKNISQRFEHAFAPAEGDIGGPLTEPLVSK